MRYFIPDTINIFACDGGKGGGEAVGFRFVDGTAETVDGAGLRGGGRWGERAEREVGESEAGDGVDEDEGCERGGGGALDVEEGVHWCWGGERGCWDGEVGSRRCCVGTLYFLTYD